MNESRLPDDFVSRLLAQDNFLSSPELTEHRRKVIERLGEAQKREHRARKFLMAAWGGCLVIIGIIFAATANGISQATGWPDWVRMALALIVLLSPLTAMLLMCVYLFRYRAELARARKQAREHALLEIPRQLDELRRELEELRMQTKKDDKTPTAGSEKAFTLMEMLVVIAILAVLASLLLPALSHAQAKGRTTVCKNNLRQMGKALAMYEADFRYFPGTGDDVVKTNQPPWFVRSPECWLSKITPYVAINSAIFTCPDYKPFVPNSESYGYNAGGSCQMNYPPHNLGLGLGKGYSLIRLSDVKAPADMIAIGDLQLPPSVARFVISPWHKRPLGSVYSVIPERHSGGANMVFLDTHLEWSRRETWIEETEKSRLRWNNDHQSHPETW